MMFICVLFFLARLLPKVKSDAGDLFSHGSMFVEDGRPILRSLSENGDSPADDFWVADLKSGIVDLVNQNGYEEAQPYIDKLIKDAESAHKVKLKVKVKKRSDLRDGDDETRRYYRRPFDYLGGETRRSLNKPHPGELWSMEKVKNYEKTEIQQDNLWPQQKINPLRSNVDWKKDFKVYVKTLAASLDRKKLKKRLQPVIKSLQDRYNVSIRDVDVDPGGEVFVTIDSLKGEPTYGKENEHIKKKKKKRSGNMKPKKEKKIKEETLSDDDARRDAGVDENYDDGDAAPTEPPPPWVHEVEVYGKYLYEKILKNPKSTEKTIDQEFAGPFRPVLEDYQKKYNVKIYEWHYDPHTGQFTIKFKPLAYETYHENSQLNQKWGVAHGVELNKIRSLKDLGLLLFRPRRRTFIMYV